ncbi:MAG TPA: helix-turn-helix transcriptional regulator [Thermoleophilaceae bacterium]|nr:helix-turn-helix transcriptional regulator [Thermoleophilaceae bacterium]
MARRLDDATLLGLVGELMGILDLEELRLAMLEAVTHAVPADWVSMNELGPRVHWALVRPDLEPGWLNLFAELGHENVLYQYWLRTRDGRAYRFSDVATREELEATRLYQDLYRPLGIRHQMSVTLPNDPDRVLALVLSRKRRDFSDAERNFLNRARPYLIQAYRNAVAHSALRRSEADSLVEALTAQGLTAREAEVVRLVAMGGSNRDIAARLGVSDRTVQKHLERGFRKLGVTTRSAAAARAWDLSCRT